MWWTAFPGAGHLWVLCGLCYDSERLYGDLGDGQSMLSSFLKAVFGTSSERIVKRMIPLLDEIRAREATYVRMTNEDLRRQTVGFKERLAQVREEFTRQHSSDEVAGEEFPKKLRTRLDEVLDEMLPDAFAVVREASKRVVGMRPFDV